jgi:hemerythrin-like domain-containing protein
VEGRRRVVARLAEELMLHSEAEERHFYPAVDSAQTADLTWQASAERQAAQQLLADLVELDPREPAFEDEADQLRDRLQAHVEQEEGELFPAAERLLTPDQLEALARQIELTLRQIQDEQAHRSAEPALH